MLKQSLLQNEMNIDIVTKNLTISTLLLQDFCKRKALKKKKNLTKIRQAQLNKTNFL